MTILGSSTSRRRLAAASAAVVAVGLIVVGNVSQAAPAEVTVAKAYVTAYTYFDNTPPGSAEISNPVLHKLAGGTGSYSDPITVAVGHSLATGKDVLDYAEGTRFYIPDLRRYFIVEDTCGDGNKPQNGPCHRLDTPGNKADAGATVWVDVWIDGKGSTKAKSNTCAEDLTANHKLLINPTSNYVVASGNQVIQGSKCDHGYGDTVVTNAPPVPTTPLPYTTVPSAPPSCLPAK